MSDNSCQSGLIYSQSDHESATFDLAIKYLQIQAVCEVASAAFHMLFRCQSAVCQQGRTFLATATVLPVCMVSVRMLFCPSSCNHPQTFFRSKGVLTERASFLFIYIS